MPWPLSACVPGPLYLRCLARAAKPLSVASACPVMLRMRPSTFGGRWQGSPRPVQPASRRGSGASRFCCCAPRGAIRAIVLKLSSGDRSGRPRAAAAWSAGSDQQPFRPAIAQAAAFPTATRALAPCNQHPFSPTLLPPKKQERQEVTDHRPGPQEVLRLQEGPQGPQEG